MYFTTFLFASILIKFLEDKNIWKIKANKIVQRLKLKIDW